MDKSLIISDNLDLAHGLISARNSLFREYMTKRNIKSYKESKKTYKE